MLKLPNKTFFPLSILLILIIALVIAGFYTQQNLNSKPSPTKGQVVANVGETKLYEADYNQHERILNGPKRYLKLTDSKVIVYTKVEVLADLVKTTKMEIGAKGEKVYPTDQEVKNAQEENLRLHPELKKTYPLYGWIDADFTRENFIVVLKQKLNDKVISWREAEYLTIRWDVIKVEANKVNSYKVAATDILKRYQSQFSSGKGADQLLATIQNDPDLIKTFLVINAVQRFKLSSDKSIRLLQRNTLENSKDITAQHILTLKIGTTDDIWCNSDACYLIRVVNGNDGKYKTLEEWLMTI